MTKAFFVEDLVAGHVERRRALLIISLMPADDLADSPH